MKFVKAKCTDGYLLLVADDADKVLTAGAFTGEENVETAENFAYTLLVNTGLAKKPDGITRIKTVGEVLDFLEKKEQSYVKSYVKNF